MQRPSVLVCSGLSKEASKVEWHRERRPVGYAVLTEFEVRRY